MSHLFQLSSMRLGTFNRSSSFVIVTIVIQYIKLWGRKRAYNLLEAKDWREEMDKKLSKLGSSSGLAWPYKYYGVESWNQPEGLHRAPSNSKVQSHIYAFGVYGCEYGAKTPPQLYNPEYEVIPPILIYIMISIFGVFYL